MLKKDEVKKLPATPGVYLFYNSINEVIYAGKALQLKLRVSSYFNKDDKSLKTKRLVSDITAIDYIEVSSEVEALILEANLIKKYKPKYNISLRDDKSFLYIVITDEEYPRVLALRKTDRKYKVKHQFGPFPSATAVRSVLKLIRKLFPYCTQSPKSKRPCFYSHIKLCNPCPSYIKKQDKEEKKRLRKKYLKNIRHIKMFLDGKLESIITTLTKEMKEYSKREEFEFARNTHMILSYLEYVRKPYYRISSFLEDREFLKTELVSQTEELVNILKPYFPTITSFKKIEGIDISNILGQETVGSLVVFINGYQDPSQYRRFKLKSKGPNDCRMICEVLERRLKNKQWDYPNLFVIDGGKAQVGASKEILHKENIPFIGLAKREETIIVPYNNGYKEIRLTKDKGALRLLQKIRDESHRFAQKYHHQLRRKLIIK